MNDKNETIIKCGTQNFKIEFLQTLTKEDFKKQFEGKTGLLMKDALKFVNKHLKK